MWEKPISCSILARTEKVLLGFHLNFSASNIDFTIPEYYFPDKDKK